MTGVQTRITHFSVPDPLPVIGTAADAKLLPDPLAIVQRIDRDLAVNARLGWIRLFDQLVRWHTVVQDEVDLLAVLSQRAIGPTDGLAATSLAQSAFLDRALVDVGRWLGVGLGEIATSAGIGRGTVYAWRRRGSAPRPGTVRSVMRLHGLVSAAVKAVGIDTARAWFHAGNPSPLAELLAANGDSDRLTVVARRVRRELAVPALPPSDPYAVATREDLTPAARAALKT